MNTYQRSFALLFALAIATPGLFAQASPRKTATATIGGKAVTVDYGAPSVRGRKVMGELVPMGDVWRLGANKATHLTAEGDIMLGKLAVPAGTYTLFALPTASGWKLIVNKKTGQWGVPYKAEYEATELGRVDMKVEKTAALVEQLAISLDGGLLKVEWENTRATVALKAK
jgi:hypothetical protein